MSTTTQFVTVPGELQIISPQSYSYSLGTIRFLDSTRTDLGQIRASGYRGFGVMIADVSGLSSGGFSVRTASAQGDSSVGGQNLPYPFTVQGTATTMMSSTIGPRDNNNPANFPVLRVQRPLSGTSTLNESILAEIIQPGLRSLETVCVDVHGGYSAVRGYLGGYYPDGDVSSSANNVIFLGVRDGNVSSSSAITKAVTITRLGEVAIPAALKAGSLSVTGDVNFDSPTFSVNSTTNHVEIQGSFQVTGSSQFDGYTTINACQFTPSKQIIGNTHQLLINQIVLYKDLLFSPNYQSLTATHQDPEGHVTAPPGSIHMSETGSAWVKETGTGNTGWHKLLTSATPDLDPITLDAAQDRVGINIPSPTTTLEVGGIIQTTRGHFQQNGIVLFEGVPTIKALPASLLALGSTVHTVQLQANATYLIDIRWGFSHTMGSSDFLEVAFTENAAQYDVAVNTNTSGYYGFYEKLYGSLTAGNPFRNLCFTIKTASTSEPWALGLKPSTTTTLPSSRNMSFTATCLSHKV
jgi:hypothetical protein